MAEAEVSGKRSCWAESSSHGRRRYDKDCPLRCGGAKRFLQTAPGKLPSPKNLKQIPGRGMADETNIYEKASSRERCFTDLISFSPTSSLPCAEHGLLSEWVSGGAGRQGCLLAMWSDSSPAELCVPDPATLESSVPPAL